MTNDSLFRFHGALAYLADEKLVEAFSYTISIGKRSWLKQAAILLLLRNVASVGKERYEVASEDGLRNFSVANGHCECHDYLRHGIGHPCKHRLALALFLKLEHPGSSSSIEEESLTDFTTLVSHTSQS